MEILDYLHELNFVSILVRSLLAMLIGGMLGFERGIKNRPAGFRTYMLVCLGAAMVMMTNQFVLDKFEVNSDVTRLGAQVISGIGFLGAGTIIVTNRSQIQGLTTAAALWVSACLGLAVGIGFYSGAIVGLMAVFIIMVLLYRVDEKIKRYNKIVTLFVECVDSDGVSVLFDDLKNKKIDIVEFNMLQEGFSSEERPTMILTLDPMDKNHWSDIAKAVGESKGVQFVKEI